MSTKFVSLCRTHWKLIGKLSKRIMRYLSGTLEHGIHLRGAVREAESGHLNLTGYCDADWASDLEDIRSTTGYCVF